MDGSAKACPECGRRFVSVLCPRCGFSASERRFADGCPVCGYSNPGAGQPGSAHPGSAPRRRERGPASPLPWWIWAMAVLLLGGALIAFLGAAL